MCDMDSTLHKVPDKYLPASAVITSQRNKYPRPGRLHSSACNSDSNPRHGQGVQCFDLNSQPAATPSGIHGSWPDIYSFDLASENHRLPCFAIARISLPIANVYP